MPEELWLVFLPLKLFFYPFFHESDELLDEQWEEFEEELSELPSSESEFEFFASLLSNPFF